MRHVMLRWPLVGLGCHWLFTGSSLINVNNFFFFSIFSNYFISQIEKNKLQSLWFKK